MSNRFVIANKINPKITDNAFYTKGRSGKYVTTKFKNLVKDKDIVITMSQAQALAGEIAQAINSDVYILSVDEYDTVAVVKTVSGNNSINESKRAFAPMSNFVSVFEELNRLYEDTEEEFGTEEDGIEKISDEDEDIGEIEDDEDEDIGEIEDDEQPKQIILECANCGALIIKDEADVEVDDEADLANIKDTCEYCEEAAGYTIIGVVAPYNKEAVTEGLFDKKANPKKIDMASLSTSNTKAVERKEVKVGDIIVGSLEFDPDDPNVKPIPHYFSAKHGPSKVTKVETNGDQVRILHKRLLGSVFDPARVWTYDSAAYKLLIYTGADAAQIAAEAPATEDEEDLKELFDAGVTVNLDPGNGNNVHVLSR